MHKTPALDASPEFKSTKTTLEVPARHDGDGDNGVEMVMMTVFVIAILLVM